MKLKENDLMLNMAMTILSTVSQNKRTTKWYRCKQKQTNAVLTHNGRKSYWLCGCLSLKLGQSLHSTSYLSALLHTDPSNKKAEHEQMTQEYSKFPVLPVVHTKCN